MFTWGYGKHNQLGHGQEVTQLDIPQQVEAIKNLKVIKATATEHSTLFLTDNNIFGMFKLNSEFDSSSSAHSDTNEGTHCLKLHSIIDYIPSEIFTGLVTSTKLLILTHNSHLYEVDTVFGENGFKQGEFIIVGFQDSIMLFAEDRTVIHWEIIALNRCRKTVYSLSDNVDCLSDLNQIFLTLNRIPFLVNNDVPLKINKLSSYFLSPRQVEIAYLAVSLDTYLT